MENAKANLTSEENIEKTEVNTIAYKLSEFKLERILNNNTNRKVASLLGTFPNLSTEDKAIVVLEKTAFTENFLQTNPNETDKSYFSEKNQIEVDFINSIYGSFHLFAPSEINNVKTTIIYPATAKHIEKYSIQSKRLIPETPTLYINITKPYLLKSQFSLEWVYNILEHKQEVERIVFEDTDPEIGFILLPDLKWDGRTPETLYMLALTNKRDIKSLRDLNETHLELLKNIRDAGCKAINNKYGLKDTQLRIYLHYQPSFYHLHVHFNALTNEAPGILCEKSHLLDTVIDNIELLSDYYQKSTLPFVAYEGNTLLEKMLAEIDPGSIQDDNRIVKKLKTDNGSE